MSQQTYRFTSTFLRRSSRPRSSMGWLLLISLGWLLLYAALGLRLWWQGLNLRDGITFGLTAGAVVLGTGLLVAWLAVWRRLVESWRWNGWPALSLAQTQILSPSEFEEYVAQRLFARHGCQIENTPDVKDGGVDVLVTFPDGHQAVVQCKRYRGTVGEAVVRDLYGTMIHAGATYAYLVTTGRISTAAHTWANGKNIQLIDGKRLVELARQE